LHPVFAIAEHYRQAYAGCWIFRPPGWHFAPRCADLVGDLAVVVAAAQSVVKQFGPASLGFLK